MNVTITKPCDIRLDGVVKALQAWTRLNLPDDKAKKLISAGYAEPCQPTADEYRELLAYFGSRDPGGHCWGWVKKHHPDLWQRHRAAFKCGNLETARTTYDEMLGLWSNQQPDLLAA